MGAGRVHRERAGQMPGLHKPLTPSRGRLPFPAGHILHARSRSYCCTLRSPPEQAPFNLPLQARKLTAPVDPRPFEWAPVPATTAAPAHTTAPAQEQMSK